MIVHASPALVEFGSRLRELRSRQGLSQELLAERAGLHRTYVGSVERGERNVALLNILRLADALRCDPGRLLEGMSA
ncbi:MAG TPA: XRE family transcriptional regulator [Acidimicrobiaceae bacterium]|nr:XRE family transcriptional regulator [Acidimicrobiaceae bacterium]